MSALRFVTWCLLMLYLASPLLGYDKKQSASALNNCWQLYSNSSLQLTQCLQDFVRDNNEEGNHSVILVICYSPQIQSYASVSAFINAAYAFHRQYDFKLLTSPEHDYFPQDKRWNKIGAILDGFQSLTSPSPTLSPTSERSDGWAKHANILVVMDADLIVTEFNTLNVIKIANAHPKAHIIMSADAYDTINSGFIIVRNTKYAFGFISTWYASRFSYECDQHAFNALYAQLKSNNRHTKIKILPRGEINSDTPLSRTFLAERSKVLHLFGLPNHVRRTIFVHAAHNVSLTLAMSSSLSSGNVTGDARKGAENINNEEQNIEMDAIVCNAGLVNHTVQFSSGIGITGPLIRYELYKDVSNRRQQLLGALHNLQQSHCHWHHRSEDKQQEILEMTDDFNTAIDAPHAWDCTEDKSHDLFSQMKQLLQITSELCTGPEQLLKGVLRHISGDVTLEHHHHRDLRNINKNDKNCNDDYHDQEYYQTCSDYFDTNILLTTELMMMCDNPNCAFKEKGETIAKSEDVNNYFGSLGVEVLAEAQNTKLEFLLEYHSVAASSSGDNCIDSGAIEETIVQSGREMLETLKTLLNLAQLHLVQLNGRSVLFRIAASHYNLAMFCLRNQKVDMAINFARQGVDISEPFVSDGKNGRVGKFSKHVSIHAALLTIYAQCLLYKNEHDKAIEMSALAIRYAESVYQMEVTEKNIYCGELFEHYMKRLTIVERDVHEVKVTLQHIDTLTKDCHITLNNFQQYIMSVARKRL